MQSNRVAERNQRRAEEKAAYERHPVKCQRPRCENTLTYGQFARGHQFCSGICAKEHITELKTGRPHPHAGNPPRRKTKPAPPE